MIGRRSEYSAASYAAVSRFINNMRTKCQLLHDTDE